MISFENMLKQLKFIFPVQHDCNGVSIARSGKLTANYLYPETFQDSVLDPSKGPYGIPDILLKNVIYSYFKAFLLLFIESSRYLKLVKKYGRLN